MNCNVFNGSVDYRLVLFRTGEVRSMIFSTGLHGPRLTCADTLITCVLVVVFMLSVRFLCTEHMIQ